MKVCNRHLLALGWAGLFFVGNARAVNPLILDQFTADPTARVFEGKMYLYPSHDIPYSPGKGRTNWFIMEDYHVFSSENLVDWTDHGVILNQTNVAWVNSASYSLWAPDCVFKNGKYYFYFPALTKSGGFGIGVATADKPYGPFKPEPKPIAGVRGIDPCVFIDKDGSAYLFYALGRISVARLKDNMLELDSKPQVITNLPPKGLIEGPFVFARNGIYYLTYPHVQNTTERIEYSTSTNPMGPYRQTGVIMDELPDGCWTVQHSIVEYQGQWYLFYHDKDLSPDFDKNRSVRADYLYFNTDGTIRKVIPTLRGVGMAEATSIIPIARYSASSGDGVSVSFFDETNRSEGWKISLKGANTWARFNQVDFGKNELKSVAACAVAPMGGTFEIRLDRLDGPLLAKIKVKKGAKWKTVSSPVTNVPTSVHDLVVSHYGGNAVELAWVRFE